NALVVEGQGELGVGEHVHVHESPSPRPELPVETCAEALDLLPPSGLSREQPVLRRSALIDPLQYLLGLSNRAAGRHEHRYGRAPAAAPAGQAMDALDVALLAVGQSRA